MRICPVRNRKIQWHPKQLSSKLLLECLVGHGLFLSSTQFLVQDVAIGGSNMDKVEEEGPVPLHCLVMDAVVAQ